MKHYLFHCLQQLPLPVKEFVLAYSGGVDSTALLHLMAELSKQQNWGLRAVHVDHQLNQHSQQWAYHCEQQCRALQVPYEKIVVSVDKSKGDSLEERARKARYDALRGAMLAGDCLLTAHHQQDQAETLLMRLIRGSGVKGMGAMKAVNTFEPGYLVRPLLDCSKAQLTAYAIEHQLTWCHDASNDDHSNFDRNYLRNQVIPLLRQRWPGIDKTLSRTALLNQNSQRLLEELAATDFKHCQGPSEDTLQVPNLVTMSTERRENLLRYWLQHLGLPLPSFKQLQRISTEVLCSSQDAQPVVAWPGAEVRRYRNLLYGMLTLTAHDACQVSDWDLRKKFTLHQQVGCLTTAEKTFIKSYLGHVLQVRYRQGGEKIQLPGRSSHHSLKKLLQQWGVPPWLRNRTPLVFHQDQLIMVVGYSHVFL